MSGMTQPQKPRPAISQADYQRLSEFRYLIRRFLEFSQIQAEDAGLTPRQHQALLAIKGFPGRRTGDGRRSGGAPAHPPSQRR